MSKHTPGPWSFYTEPQPSGCPIVGAKGLMIAQLAHSINYNDQAETAIANARLIAAAPELLEALQKMLDVWEHGGIATYPIGEARAAISKATGGQQ